MKTVTQIDASGRLVIPKNLRKRYGLESGQRVRLVPGEEGVTLVPERPQRRFIKRGPILTIDTGAGTAPIEIFDVSDLREDHLEEKTDENRHR
ncbi:MAG: AbrB/MazE/SpoVT family DNA-binding domain-containing protein [Deltaproteobacteria bacterium]|jgi:AbrB family looped-hinge helix DNA binding protein|nr:AbrB/MazE/SpoVT family DNA-binding domain-containing protein [Deltaproteobacteria bacterium]